MSRIAKMPVKLPQGVNATLAADVVTVKGAKGALTLQLSHLDRRRDDTACCIIETQPDCLIPQICASPRPEPEP